MPIRGISQLQQFGHHRDAVQRGEVDSTVPSEWCMYVKHLVILIARTTEIWLHIINVESIEANYVKLFWITRFQTSLFAARTVIAILQSIIYITINFISKPSVEENPELGPVSSSSNVSIKQQLTCG